MKKNIFFEADGGGGSELSAEQKKQSEETKVSFSAEQQAHIDKMIAAEKARIEARVEKRNAEHLKALEEAERLKSMSEAERKEAELEQARQKIAEYERKELTNQFKVELSSKGLPTHFVDHFAISNADQAKGAIDTLSKFKEEIETPLKDENKRLQDELANARLKGFAPKIAEPSRPQRQTGSSNDVFSAIAAANRARNKI